MDYDNNRMNNSNNNLRTNQIRNESEDQRTRRQNRIGLVILGVAVLAFIGGFAATMDKREAGITETPATTSTTAVNTTATGTNEAAIAPAAGSATATTSSADMTGTGVNSMPAANGTDMAATTATSEPATSSAATTATSTPSTTEPVTENPKVYTSEESCRGSVNGACQPVSGGWAPVNPAPEKTAVPEAIAPAMTATSPSDSNED